MTALVVTISATYGAGGTVVAPLVARRLGLPLVERIVTPELARELREDRGRETVPPDELADTGWRRFVQALARLPAVFGSTMPQPTEPIDTEARLRWEAERTLRGLLETGGVAMGRAGMVVLGGEPGVFHVRLDGPVEARLRQGMEIERITDEAEARRRLADTDNARLTYLRRFYDCDPTNSRLYHLVLDSTAVPLSCCAQVIVESARAFAERAVRARVD
jgi:cytidylate kinase